MSSTETKYETGLAIGAIGIQRRVVLSNREDITFSAAVDATTDGEEVQRVLDVISAAADRERLKAELSEAELALRAARDQPKMIDKEIARWTSAREAAIASYRNVHDISGRRGDYRPSKAQQIEIDKIEGQIAAARQNKASFARDIPITEYRVACLKAQIAGEPEPPMPVAVEQALSAAVASLSDAAD